MTNPFGPQEAEAAPEKPEPQPQAVAMANALYRVVEAKNEAQANKYLASAVEAGYEPVQMSAPDRGHLWILFKRIKNH